MESFREPGFGEHTGDPQRRVRHHIQPGLHPGVVVTASYAPGAVGEFRPGAHDPVVPPQVNDRADRPEVRRRVYEWHVELLEYRYDARRKPLKVLGVDDVRSYLLHVLPCTQGHELVLVIKTVITPRDALLPTADPAHGDTFELVVLYLSRLDVFGGYAALRGQDIGLVAPGSELSRQSQRDDLDAGVVLREELVRGKEDSHGQELPIGGFS